MRTLNWILLLSCFWALEAWAQTEELKKASEYFSQGKYQATVEELVSHEQKNKNSPHAGLIAYWKAISYNRLQFFKDAIENFEKAISLKYNAIDLNYEYGQALFASEKLKKARTQFRLSSEKGFKKSVSLYYIAYISKELGERKTAVSYFKIINKLPPEESQDVRQAAAFQIGDICAEIADRHKDAFKKVETIVIPQYKHALAIDEESALAPQIREKIVNLQRKYELVLFNLRNGRPALNPPYFLRLSEEVGIDSNVTFSPALTTISKSHQSSAFSKTDMIGRYTFYYKNFFSYAPEFRFNQTYYYNRVPDIYRNDNYLLAPALRTAYEHSLWNKPAATLLDYEYSDARRDVNQRKQYDFSSRSHTLMLGQRFNFFDFGESIIRLRERLFQSYISSSDSKTTSLVFEQIRNLKASTLLFYGSLDRTRVDNSIYDTNAMTLRTDWILGRVRDWFTPSMGLALTSTDPINNRSARGRELLVNPNARLSKTFAKRWRGNLKYDYQKNNSKDKQNFAYRKQVYSFELEFLF
jgi:hypothetical protein